VVYVTTSLATKNVSVVFGLKVDHAARKASRMLRVIAEREGGVGDGGHVIILPHFQRAVPSLDLPFTVAHRTDPLEPGLSDDLASAATTATGPASRGQNALTLAWGRFSFRGRINSRLLPSLHSLLALEPLVLGDLRCVLLGLGGFGQDLRHFRLGQLRRGGSCSILENLRLPSLGWNNDRIAGTGGRGGLFARSRLASAAGFKVRSELVLDVRSRSWISGCGGRGRS
jgi:hypothetical protein